MVTKKIIRIVEEKKEKKLREERFAWSTFLIMMRFKRVAIKHFAKMSLDARY